MQSHEQSRTTRAETVRTKLCRYCRRFLGQSGKHGICGKCWKLDTESPSE